ncbi:choice-of-anchor L domain-containing protein, partial [Flavobacterium rhizosphaerae]
MNPNMSAAQLVDELVESDCLLQISNISKTTGTNFGYAAGNGLGYFTNTNPNFPMSSGVVLTSGSSVAAQGPNTTVSSFYDIPHLWVGDAQFNAAFAAGGVPVNSHNATILEFDFVAASPNLSIPYIFASEEYGAFQCESKDGLAILLTNLTEGTPAQNIAKVPGTNQPVSVTTVRNVLNNSGCSSQNSQYFGTFNGGGAAATAPINFEGQTIMLTATATLIPGNTYHIKVVIADDGGTSGTDGEYDSAVFFPSGSFDLGQQVVGPDMSFANGTALCAGDTYTIDTQLNPSVYNLSWTKGNSPFPGGASVTISEPDTYALSITNPNTGCSVVQEVVVDYAPQLMPGAPNNLYACDDGSGSYSYNLSQNTTIVKSGLNPQTIVTYHATQDDANNNANALPFNYITNNPGTIWVRVKSHNSSCYVVLSFQLLTMPEPVAVQPASGLTLCESSPGSGTAVFNISQLTSIILGNEPASQNTVSYFINMSNAVNNVSAITSPGSYTSATQTIYARLTRNFDDKCYDIVSFTITVVPLPVIDDVENVQACDSYTLPNLSAGNYYTMPNGNGTMLNPGDVITSSQTIYVYATTNTNPACSAQDSFTVEIISAGGTPEDVIACQSYTLPALPSGQHYYNGANGSGGEIPAGTVITSTQVVYFYIPAAALCTANEFFTVTITTTPLIDEPEDVNVCTQTYTLPALTNGSYYTEPDGGGTQLFAGDVISSSQTLYVYSGNPNSAQCTAENSFTVTISYVSPITPVDDVEKCNNYILPQLQEGQQYRTHPGGGGNQIDAGSNITSSQTIYIYAQSPTNADCYQEESFTVTINPLPPLSPISNVTACNSYTLPALPTGVNYYNGNNPSPNSLIPQGSVITQTQQIFAITSPNAFGCIRRRSFTVTIIGSDPPPNPGNQTVCSSYTLPSLLGSSKYFSQSGGVGQISTGSSITSTQTIYVYVEDENDPTCNAESSFVVTVIQPPALPATSNVIACNSYTLPPLSSGGYYAQPDGQSPIAAGTQITSTQTVYVWAVTNTTPSCTNQSSFTVTIINGSIAPENVTACGSYTLPDLPVGNYYSSPNGVGPIPVGTAITSTQNVYTYANVTSGANCTANNYFTVTIEPAIIVDGPPDVSVCGSYILPPLSNGSYYTGSLGTGTQYNPGDVITATDVIYIYASNPNVPGCYDESNFKVTIINIDVADIPDQLVCEQEGFALPALAQGNYYTLPGGPSGGGTQLFPNDIITTDQTIYIYAQTNTNPVCSDEESFTVTIKPAPAIADPGIVVVCGGYTLPALTVGEYFTGPGGTGTQYQPGDEITTTQDIYIYAESGGLPNCVAENVFQVVVNPEPPDDVWACDSYMLPQLPFGNYFTAPAGGGQPMFAGDVITTTQDVYVYVQSTSVPNCTDNNFFTITISVTPDVLPIEDVEVCDSYQLPELSVGNYYTGPGGTGTVLPEGSYITSSQTVYVYAQTGTVPNCTDEESFDVLVHVTPVPDARSIVERCFSYELDELVTGDYYALSGGPDVPGQVAYFAGDVITSTMTMYIYTESPTSSDCWAENSFNIVIYSIEADDPGTVEACDVYTLPALGVGDYYTLPGGPSTAGQQLIAPGTDVTTDTTLYIYAELGGRINCNDENEFNIIINQTPQVDDTQEDLSVCFTYTLPVLNVGEYFTASGGQGQQMFAGDEITSSQTIYIYAATGTGNMCWDEHSYFVTVNSVEVVDVEDFYACESYTLPALAVGNYFTQPGGQGTMLPFGTVITTDSTIYIYAETNTVPNCTDEDDFTVTIVPRPVAIQPDPLVTCGIDDIGHGVFNLLPGMEQALGTQPNVAYTIYETQEDADFGNSPITDFLAYYNIEAFSQTLYIRLESTFENGCYTTIPIQLIVNPRPIAITPADYALCDNGQNDTDGQAIFDLGTVHDEVLGTMNPTLFTVSYYDDETNAENGVSPITNPGAYLSGTAVIYIRVTNNETGCYDVVALQLIVNPLPVVNDPVPYSLCDVNNPGDETEVFDLTTKIAEITGGANGMNVTFNHTYNDAVDNVNEITTPDAYSNVSTVEALFVRVTDDATGCYRIVLLDVRVEPLPVIVPPTQDDLTTCDTNGMGIGVFDLEALIEDMVNNGAGLEVTFHETPEDAQNDLNAIPNTGAYNNASPFLQFLYVRVENTVTGCFNTYQLSLIVEPAPQVPDMDDIELCDDTDNNNQDGRTYVDLTQQNGAIEAVLGTGYTIEYFTSEANADAGTPKIITPTHYLAANGQVLWVRVENPVTECYSITSFEILLHTPVDVVTPTPLVLCNEALPNDGQTEFNLTVKDEEILGVWGVGQGNTVTYYESLADRDNDNPIATPEAYTNPAPPQGNPKTLQVVVTTPEGCKSYTTLTIKVLPLPVPDTTPDALVQCDDNGNGDGVEPFDLTEAEDDIRNNDNSVIITYYTSEEDAATGDNPIPDPANHVSGTATVWVRVAANTGNPNDPVCYQVVALELVVNPLPALGDEGVIEPYAICEPDTDGFASFDLTAHYDEILIGEDPSDYTITFSYNSMPVPYTYTNVVANSQTIDVKVVNNETGCEATAPLTLLVEPQATANPIVDEQLQQTCDTDGDNDGYYSPGFDLTVVAPEVLGSQDAAIHQVTYYESLEEAQAGTNAIADPTAYVNSTPYGMTIWVRIINTTTVSGCADFTSFELLVEPLPEP